MKTETDDKTAGHSWNFDDELKRIDRGFEDYMCQIGVGTGDLTDAETQAYRNGFYRILEKEGIRPARVKEIDKTAKSLRDTYEKMDFPTLQKIAVSDAGAKDVVISPLVDVSAADYVGDDIYIIHPRGLFKGREVLAHEIGHVILGHLNGENRCKGDIETEADYFARTLLNESRGVYNFKSTLYAIAKAMNIYKSLLPYANEKRKLKELGIYPKFSNNLWS